MLKVVIVDDEAIQRRGLIFVINWDQFDCKVVGEAGSGDEAIEVIRQVKPDIVITDIRMPRKSGLDVIADLRDSVDCEFIIISGHSEFAYAKQALEMGVHRYILKPIDDYEFEQAVKSTVEFIYQKRHVQKLHMESKLQNKEGDFLYKTFGDGQASNRYLEKAMQYIAENCEKNLTVRDVANVINISQSYLWKLFSENSSLTFNEYLTMCRVRKAIRLLADEQMRIYEIAEACGYKDARYFSNVFRKIVGVNPTEYRSGEIPEKVV